MKRFTQIALTTAAVLAFSTAAAYAAPSLAVTAPGLNGTGFKMAITMDGVAGLAYVQEGTASFMNETNISARFWFRGDSWTTNDGMRATHDIVKLFGPGGDLSGKVLARRTAGGNFRVRLFCPNDGGGTARTSWLTLGTGAAATEREIQVDWTAGSPGDCTITRISNGTSRSVAPTNPTKDVRRFRTGAVGSIDTNAMGDYSLDEFVVTR